MWAQAGVIEGCADDQQSLVLLNMVINLQKKSSWSNCCAWCEPKGPPTQQRASRTRRTCMLEHLNHRTRQSVNRPLLWLLGDSAPEAVKTDTSWPKLLSNTEDLNTCLWLKSRVGICLEALAATIPSYTDKYPLLRHRKNSKWLWRDELWTLRSFASEELVCCPIMRIRTGTPT